MDDALLAEIRTKIVAVQARIDTLRDEDVPTDQHFVDLLSLESERKSLVAEFIGEVEAIKRRWSVSPVTV